MSKPEMSIASYTPDWVSHAAVRSGDVAYRWDMQSDRIEWWDSAMRQVSNGSWPDTGHVFMSRIHPVDLPKRMKALTKHIQSSGFYECDFRLRMQSKGFIWMHDRGQVIGDRGMFLLGLMRSVSERKLDEETQQESLLRDPVTFHLSRRRLREEVERLLLRLRMDNRQSAIISVCYVNENALLATEYKDLLLTLLGAALEDCASPLDYIGKLTETHFALLLDHINPGDITAISASLRANIQKYADLYIPKNRAFPIHVASLFFRGSPNKPDSIIANAEDALIRASRLGQSDFSMTFSDGGSGLAHAHHIAKIMRDAKDEGDIYFTYQPIVGAKSHKPILYESLIRLKDRQGIQKQADYFVPAMELLGEMRWLDRYVLEKAAHFLTHHPNIKISINISGLTVTDPSWARMLRLIAMGQPSLSHRLVIEITETAAVADLDETARFISHARHLGCQVAIDDFGAGFTSFRQLKGLSVDMVKIDGEFTRDILKNEDHQLFLRHLVTLGKEAGFTTIAEYVETKEQADFMTDIGVDYLQGFYFGRTADL